MVAISVRGFEAGEGLSNQQQAQSAEAEKQCASSSDKLHIPQKEPELIQSALHQGIIQGRFDDQLYFPCREMLFFENLNNFNAEIYTQIDCSCAARTNHTAGLMQKPNTFLGPYRSVVAVIYRDQIIILYQFSEDFIGIFWKNPPLTASHLESSPQNKK